MIDELIVELLEKDKTARIRQIEIHQRLLDEDGPAYKWFDRPAFIKEQKDIVDLIDNELVRRTDNK